MDDEGADGDMELGVVPQQQLVKSGSMGSYKGARTHKVILHCMRYGYIPSQPLCIFGEATCDCAYYLKIEVS